MTLHLTPTTDTNIPTLTTLTTHNTHNPLNKNQLHTKYQQSHTHIITTTNNNHNLINYILYQHITNKIKIHNIIINPNHQHHNIKKTIFQQIISTTQTNHYNHIILNIQKTNNTTITLYHSLNFKSIKTHSNYYQQNQKNTILIQLTIKKQPTNT